MSDNKSKVVEVIARVAELDNTVISADANMRDDLDIDSFRRAEITFELEKVFGIKMPDDEYAAAETIGDIVALVESLLA